MTWPPEGTQGFVEWLDAEFGQRERAYIAGRVGSSEYEAGAVWSLVLVHAWHVGAGFEQFVSAESAGYWLRSRVRWAMRVRAFQRLHERDWEQHMGGRVALPDADALRAAEPVEPAEPFTDVRLAEAWDAVTAKRRAALECVVLGGMRPVDAAEVLGVRPCSVHARLTKGLDELRRRYDGTYADGRGKWSRTKRVAV